MESRKRSFRSARVCLAFAVTLGVAALACTKPDDATFCAQYKTDYVKRCSATCLQSLEKPSARPACEEQCVKVLPNDAIYSARCVSGAAPTPSAAASH